MFITPHASELVFVAQRYKQLRVKGRFLKPHIVLCSGITRNITCTTQQINSIVKFLPLEMTSKIGLKFAYIYP